MIVTLELRPEIEARVKQIALSQGKQIEEFLAAIIETNLTAPEDVRFIAMREAMSDNSFLADLAEVMDDFKYVDAE